MPERYRKQLNHVGFGAANAVAAHRYTEVQVQATERGIRVETRTRGGAERQEDFRQLDKVRRSAGDPDAAEDAARRRPRGKAARAAAPATSTEERKRTGQGPRDAIEHHGRTRSAARSLRLRNGHHPDRDGLVANVRRCLPSPTSARSGPIHDAMERDRRAALSCSPRSWWSAGRCGDGHHDRGPATTVNDAQTVALLAQVIRPDHHKPAREPLIVFDPSRAQMGPCPYLASPDRGRRAVSPFPPRLRLHRLK